jgi:hypothetical protein
VDGDLPKKGNTTGGRARNACESGQTRAPSHDKGAREGVGVA